MYLIPPVARINYEMNLILKCITYNIYLQTNRVDFLEILIM